MTPVRKGTTTENHKHCILITHPQAHDGRRIDTKNVESNQFELFHFKLCSNHEGNYF